MQTDQQILLVDNDPERSQKLSLLFRFIGEQVEPISLDQLSQLLCTNRYRVVLIACDLISDSIAAIIHKHNRQAFITIGSAKLAYPNVLGEMNEPFSYEVVTQLLHYSQVFGRNRRSTVSSCAHHTKLFRSLVGSSESLVNVRQLISQVAKADASVLITGESGTGKEVVARNIHYISDRRDGPFIPVNCGAIPSELLESELFGHEKGAFTGAISTRKGRFELADGGTLFLDEIGDMPAHMQVKILRFLQERSFERVGGSKQVNANVRIVAATHRNLEKMITDGEFREDLYYRLNVFPIDMPELRSRREDVPLLLNELVNRLENEGKGSVRFTRRALASLVEHPWPGNVRELSNLVERMVILCPGGLVDVNDLPLKYRYGDQSEYVPEPLSAASEEEQEGDMLAALFSGDEPIEISEPRFANELPQDGVNLKDMLSELEIDMIRQALDQGGNVVARAAELLGMRRTTLVEKMRKYGLNK
ncbi:sigma-54 dependent transcriptional regulator [Ferrimonas lipolytica]|uniref:Sigma-54-dependent Fis family transcriptional regulator n=1 Tax=Ferrimonas lipolytica TaxID=2724191 RepID=A0A6H1UFF5_9GAMM|nr:sigma-54 dependent transcriptional regulator [Ferrimonas lipolytica]QIZ77359.1 sigma-54-dependent Fis family transcriptional regulator [Ferrimonas lipolytica]